MLQQCGRFKSNHTTEMAATSSGEMPRARNLTVLPMAYCVVQMLSVGGLIATVLSSSPARPTKHIR